MRQSALVLFSGGQDSTVCLAWALPRYELVETIGFHYDQKHVQEINARAGIIRRLRDRGIGCLGADHLLNIETFRVVKSALLQKGGTPARTDGLPDTFVPGRNLVFLLTAGIIAKERDINDIVGGMCDTDYSGYPDCRDDTMK